MQIKSIYINNFRGINDFQIDNLSGNSIVVGRNDSGKTNFCYAIRKVLDPEIRKISFNDADTTNNNKKDIKISIILDANNISDDNRSILGNHIDRDNTITIALKAIYDNDTGFFEESIVLGSLDKSKEYATNNFNPVDKVLDLIYINPNYNLDKDKSRFFAFRSKKDKEEDRGLTSKVEEEVKTLNRTISEEDIVIEINEDLNKNSSFDPIFEKVKFKTVSNVNASNIYKSLEIMPYDDDNENLNNVGDGKSKTLSLLLKTISRKNEKEKIIVCEEPENHMYPQLQRIFSDLISSIEDEQFIITTHSSHIIDFNKTERIIKLINSNGNVSYKVANVDAKLFKEFGQFFNQEFAEALFYDSILLVEGHSEKYFYNRLTIEDKDFLKTCNSKNLGIYSVGGINFKPFKDVLLDLGIEVYIKTDNDIFKVPKIKPDTCRYAGIERMYNSLDDEKQDEFRKILKVESIQKETFRFESEETKSQLIEANMKEICDFFEKERIFISMHHDGFEKDFIDFLGSNYGDEEIYYLKNAKLKNLHSFIEENGIKLSVNDENKSSILVRFIYV
jgi:putative ATP-dependent endonuclease of OLD family